MAEEEIDDETDSEEEDGTQEDGGGDQGDGADDQDNSGDGKDPYEGLDLEQAIERLKKAEKAITKHKKAPDTKKPVTKKPEGEQIPEWGKQIIQSEEKRQFGYDKKLSPEQVDALYRYAGGKTPDDEMLERPEVKAMIGALAAKDRVAANTPKGGSATVYKGKTYGETVTDPKASKSDKEGAFAAAQKRHGVAA